MANSTSTPQVTGVNGKAVPQQHIVTKWSSPKVTVEESDDDAKTHTRILPCCPKCGNSDINEEAGKSIKVVTKFATSGYDLKCLCCGENWHCYHPVMAGLLACCLGKPENCIRVSKDFDIEDASQWMPIEATMTEDPEPKKKKERLVDPDSNEGRLQAIMEQMRQLLNESSEKNCNICQAYVLVTVYPDEDPASFPKRSNGVIYGTDKRSFHDRIPGQFVDDHYDLYLVLQKESDTYQRDPDMVHRWTFNLMWPMNHCEETYNGQIDFGTTLFRPGFELEREDLVWFSYGKPKVGCLPGYQQLAALCDIALKETGDIVSPLRSQEDKCWEDIKLPTQDISFCSARGSRHICHRVMLQDEPMLITRFGKHLNSGFLELKDPDATCRVSREAVQMLSMHGLLLGNALPQHTRAAVNLNVYLEALYYIPFRHFILQSSYDSEGRYQFNMDKPSCESTLKEEMDNKWKLIHEMGDPPSFQLSKVHEKPVGCGDHKRCVIMGDYYTLFTDGFVPSNRIGLYIPDHPGECSLPRVRHFRNEPKNFYVTRCRPDEKGQYVSNLEVPGKTRIRMPSLNTVTVDILLPLCDKHNTPYHVRLFDTQTLQWLHDDLICVDNTEHCHRKQAAKEAGETFVGEYYPDGINELRHINLGYW